MKHYRSLIAAAPFALTLSALAHPGHGLGDQGVLHAVTNPYHVSVLALFGAGLWCGARFVQRRIPRSLLQGAGAVAFLAAVVLLGVRA